MFKRVIGIYTGKPFMHRGYQINDGDSVYVRNGVTGMYDLTFDGRNYLKLQASEVELI